jgi:hypothetical protein
VVHFVAAPDQQRGAADESLFLRLIRRLIEVSNANDKAVRFRASELIASMMNQLDEEAELEYATHHDALLPSPCSLTVCMRTVCVCVCVCVRACVM